MKTEPKEYAFYLSSKAIEHDTYLEGNKGSLRLEVVCVDPAGKIRNPDSMYDGFADLTFSCRWEQKGEAVEAYGFTVVYRNLYQIEYQDLGRITKMLQRARKVEEKFPVRPTGFGQWLQLMAIGLGVSKLIECTQARGSMYSESEHRTWKQSDIQCLIERRLLDVIPEKAAV